ncbi:hypothetical protein E1301_Tti001907 [Triplophysa tibetana]|uniref:Uncharacterized protein n=1 Tax=Triplophysa tibetana TaxID=1572043 RepID=A0A5A9PGR5_9TELE|nr:hypothetical protein E1301_Tti001907 [Triplophysa tibetana]
MCLHSRVYTRLDLVLQIIQTPSFLSMVALPCQRLLSTAVYIPFPEDDSNATNSNLVSGTLPHNTHPDTSND